MFKNKVAIFIILILALLSIGLASAEDVSSLNATVSTDLMNDSSAEDVASVYSENNSLDVVSEDNGDTLTGESSNYNLTSKSFTDLNKEINSANGTLTLDSNYKMLNNESSTFKDGITISKNISIDGNGFTINANNLGRIFNIIGVLLL